MAFLLYLLYLILTMITVRKAIQQLAEWKFCMSIFWGLTASQVFY